jgi:hypothetical protein
LVRLDYAGDSVDFATTDDLAKAVEVATSAAYTAGTREVHIIDSEAPNIILICERLARERTPTDGY